MVCALCGRRLWPYWLSPQAQKQLPVEASLGSMHEALEGTPEEGVTGAEPRSAEREE